MWELLSDPTADKINVSHIPITTSGSGDFVSSITVNSGTPGSIAVSYGSIPVATSSKLGGIKIGYTTSAANRNYAVQLSSEKAYVNVPWVEYSAGMAANVSGADTTAKVWSGSVLKSAIEAYAGVNKTGTVTSVALAVPTGLSVSGSPITTNGTITIGFENGYSIPTTAKQGNWDTVYGYFSNGVLPYNHGGTGQSSYTKGDLIYASAANTLAKLAANSTTTKKFLSMTSSVPSWVALTASDMPTMYWANVQLQSQSDDSTTPTFGPGTKLKYVLGNNYRPESNELWASPVPKYYFHDLFAFGRGIPYPEIEVSSDGVTWTAATEAINNSFRKLFCCKE